MPRNPNKGRCQIPRCKAWAMRDHTHCRSHRDLELGPRGAGAPKGNFNALKTAANARSGQQFIHGRARGLSPTSPAFPAFRLPNHDLETCDPPRSHEQAGFPSRHREQAGVRKLK
jgi:hypothetical protein